MVIMNLIIFFIRFTWYVLNSDQIVSANFLSKCLFKCANRYVKCLLMYTIYVVSLKSLINMHEYHRQKVCRLSGDALQQTDQKGVRKRLFLYYFLEN